MTLIDYMFWTLVVLVLFWVSSEALSITPSLGDLVVEGDGMLQAMRSDLF
jgi:hypothetical protein